MHRQEFKKEFETSKLEVKFVGSPLIDLVSLTNLRKGDYSSLIQGKTYTISEVYHYTQDVTLIKLDGVPGWFLASAFTPPRKSFFLVRKTA